MDVDAFEYHRAAGRRLEREGRVDEAAKEYELAVELYLGDYLEEDPYEEWTLLRREALKDTYLAILSKLAERSMKEEDYESGIIYCQKTLARDSCREDSYRQLMRCYSRLGQRSRALCWYQFCVRTLKVELDTSPDHQTVALYHRLMKSESI